MHNIPLLFISIPILNHNISVSVHKYLYPSVHNISSLYSQSFPLYIQYFSLRQQYYPSVHGIPVFVPIMSTSVHSFFLASVYISFPSIHRYFPSSPPFRFFNYYCSLYHDGNTISFASVTTAQIETCSHQITTFLLNFALRNDSNRYLNVTTTLN